MSMRLQEIHPAVVHFPITLLPLTLGLDLLGRVTRNEALLGLAPRGIALTATAAAGAAAAGLLAQEASEFDETSRDLLVTHRNLNLGLLGLTAWMAVRRRRMAKPSARYLLAGLGGVLVMTYSAYLGGHMVYERGVGVRAAGGLKDAEAPELVPGNADRVAEVSARHVKDGLRHTLAALARGEILPWLTRETTPAGDGRRAVAAPS